MNSRGRGSLLWHFNIFRFNCCFIFSYLDPTRKALKDGVLPTLNLPVKSVLSSCSVTRATLAINKREEALSVRIEPVPSLPYSSFADFNRKIALLKLTPNWSILSHESLVCATLFDIYSENFWVYVN